MKHCGRLHTADWRYISDTCPRGRKSRTRRNEMPSIHVVGSRHARNRKLAGALFAATLASAGLHYANAADGTWTSAGGDFSWTTAGNWLNGVIPGSTDGATGSSTDTATFNLPGGAGTEVLADINRNVKNIAFDINAATSSGQAIGVLNLSPNPIYLTGGGSVTVTAKPNTTSSCSINNRLVLLGDSYSFINNSATSSVGLKP